MSSATQRSTRFSHEASVGVVEVEQRPFQQPPVDQRSLMPPIIIKDEMHVPAGLDAGLQGLEEPTEGSGAVSLVELSNDAPVFPFQGGEQRGCPMTTIVMRWLRCGHQYAAPEE